MDMYCCSRYPLSFRMLSCLISVVVFWSFSIAPRVASCQSQSLAAQYEEIQNEYLRAIKTTEGRKKVADVVANRTAKLNAFANSNIGSIESISNVDDLDAVMRACESNRSWDEVGIVADRILSIFPRNTAAWAAKVRIEISNNPGRSNIEALKEATRSCEDASKIDPYWGLLGVRFSGLGEHELSISCFKEYLERRLEVSNSSWAGLMTSRQVLVLLQTEFTRNQNFQGFEEFVRSLEGKAVNTVGDKKDESICFRIMLQSFLKNGEELSLLLDFLQQKESVQESKTRAVSVALEFATESSHDWEFDLAGQLLADFNGEATNQSKVVEHLLEYLGTVESAKKKILGDKSYFESLKPLAGQSALNEDNPTIIFIAGTKTDCEQIVQTIEFVENSKCNFLVLPTSARMRKIAHSKLHSRQKRFDASRVFLPESIDKDIAEFESSIWLLSGIDCEVAFYGYGEVRRSFARQYLMAHEDRASAPHVTKRSLKSQKVLGEK